MDEFERLLALNRAALERFVRYRVPGRADATDVIQETLIAAYRAFDSLRDPASFKPWLMSIARNKARDWFRNRARELALPLDALSERVLTDGRRAQAMPPPSRTRSNGWATATSRYSTSTTSATCRRPTSRGGWAYRPAPSRAAAHPPVQLPRRGRTRAPGWTRRSYRYG